MKTLFIPVKYKADINLNSNKIRTISKKLPKSIAIAYSIQYQNIALKIKDILSKNHKITSFVQVLGCSKLKFPKETRAVLLISSGRFHGISLAIDADLPIYILENDKFSLISKNEIEEFRKKKKAAYMKFLNSEKVGILVSVKPGQENLGKAIQLKSKIKNKKCYLFISNEIDTRQFENFPEIQSWINTACPRMDFDSSVINIEDLEKKK